MPVSDEDKHRIMDALERIEHEQTEQNTRLSALEDGSEVHGKQLDSIDRTLKGDPEEPEEPGIRAKVSEMYKILQDFRSIRKFVYGVAALVALLGGSRLIEFVVGLFTGAP